MPAVSVIMPAYNASLYLSQAIESVVRQTFRDWELIIIDDGSTDTTLRTARAYEASDPRIRVIRRDSPSGSAFTPRLDGIKEARAALIAPLDADDAILPDYLESMLQRLKESGAEVVYPLMRFLRPEGPGDPLVATDGTLTDRVISGTEGLRLTLGEWKVTCNGGLIPKRLYLDAFQAYGENHNDVNSDETLTRWLLALADKVMFTSIPYLYRENPESITHILSIRRLDILKSCTEIIDLTRSRFPAHSEEAILAHRHLLLHVYDCLDLIADPGFPRKDMEEAMSRIETALGKIDFPLLKGRVAPHLWRAAQWPVERLRMFARLRRLTKNSAETGSRLLKRVRRPVARRIDAMRRRRLERQRLASELSSLRKGILPPRSESELLYHKYYQDSAGESASRPDGVKMIVCPFDGRVVHGGTTDRLRGVLSTYAEARRRGIPFRISWTTPFRLEDYLEPATFDWRVSPEGISFRKGEAYPVVIQDRGNEESDAILSAALDSLSGELHVYSNSDSGIGHYKELYQELFRPTRKLRETVEFHRKRLGEGYHTFSFRFAKLLGDFYDVTGEVLPEPQRREFMEKVAGEFHRLAATIPADRRILLASDSNTFLEFMAGRDPRIYIVEGEVSHVDLGGKESGEDAWLKMFVDQQLIMGAEKVWRLTAKGMYPTGFPRFAAEVGGAEFIDHRF